MHLILRTPKILYLANMGLGILLIFGGLFVVRDLVTSPLGQVKRTDVLQTKPEPNRSFEDYRVLMEKNPFNFPVAELRALTASESNVSAPPAPKVEATLIGTISGPPEKSAAIFLDNSGKQEMFRIGDLVFGLQTLKRIRTDRVYLDYQGGEMEIALAEMGGKKGFKTMPQEGTGHPGLVQPMGNENYVLDQKMVSATLENPNQIMTEARLLPYVVDGKQQGFMLAEVKPGGIYESLGLQDDDVLVRVNGRDISSPESALQSLTALKGMDRVALDIIRNGDKMTLTYQIR
jgi:general secretion pathway protein C